MHCGTELAQNKHDKKGGSARFKGTMMMMAPAAAQAGAANVNSQSETAKPAAPTPTPEPGSGATAAPHTSLKPVNAKATMIGQGIAPAVAAAVRHAQPAQAAPAHEPVAASHGRAHPASESAPRQVSSAHETVLGVGIAKPLLQQAAAPDPDALHSPSASQSDAHRYLPGDPMAPGARTRSAARASAPRLKFDEDAPIARPRDRKLLMFAIGGVVLLTLLLLAFGLMH